MDTLCSGAGFSDYFQLGLIGYGVIGAEGIRYGFGVHQWDVPKSNIHQFRKVGSVLLERDDAENELTKRFQLVNAAEIFYCPLIFTTKLSISLLYLRIFVPNNRGLHYYVAHALIWFNLLLYVAIMMLSIFQCIPRGRIWDSSVPGHCINLGVCQTISASMNVFSDFAMLLLPIESIWHLQMATKQKVGITAVFAVGLL